MAEVIAKSKAHKVFTRVVYTEPLTHTWLAIDAPPDGQGTRGQHET